MSSTLVTSPDTPNPPPLPERIGTVRITGQLGHGAMGHVYQGVDEALHRPVAVKVLATVKDVEASERFEREAQALARLCHPNVVQVYSKGVVDGRPYFCMELVTGPTVLDVLEQQGPFSVAEAVEIGRQVALGLRAAAEAGVTHRDVKPANLLIAPDGTVKVADFGVCKIEGRSPGVTETGTTLGTPFYMAPEQARGEAVDSRADQYALGATLFHLLTGQTPFAATDTMAQLLAHQQQPIPSVRKVRPDVPAALARVLQRMVTKDPAHRFPTYDDVIQALESALSEEAAPRVRGVRVALWSVALLATGAAVIIPLWLSTELDQPVQLPTAPVPPIQAAIPRPRPPEPGPPPQPAASLPAEAVRPSPDQMRQGEVDLVLARLDAATGPERAAAMTLLARSREGRARTRLEEILKDEQDPDAPLAAVLLGEMGTNPPRTR